MGKKVIILQDVDDGTCDYTYLKEALERKGFAVEIYCLEEYSDRNKYDRLDPDELEEKLRSANQLWIMSSSGAFGDSEEYYDIIESFFHKKCGLYFAGTRSVFSDFLLRRLFGIENCEHRWGQKNVKAMPAKKKKGLVSDHTVAEGITEIYEGRAINNIEMTNPGLTPLLYGSDKKVVVACYDANGRRAVIDGGYERFTNVLWDNKGTERFAQNCAKWLLNS